MIVFAIGDLIRAHKIDGKSDRLDYGIVLEIDPLEEDANGKFYFFKARWVHQRLSEGWYTMDETSELYTLIKRANGK